MPVSGKEGDLCRFFYAPHEGTRHLPRAGTCRKMERPVSKSGRDNAAAYGGFSTSYGKTFNFSTEFYTLYSVLSTIFVENSVENVEKHGKSRQVFHIFPECYSLYITLC